MPVLPSRHLAFAALVLAAPAFAATEVTWANPSSAGFTITVVDDPKTAGWMEVPSENKTLKVPGDACLWPGQTDLKVRLSSWPDPAAHLRLRISDSRRWYEFTVDNPRTSSARLAFQTQSDDAEIPDVRNRNPFDLTKGGGSLTIWPNLNRWPARK